MKNLFLILVLALTSCGSDVSIMKRPDEAKQETGNADTEVDETSQVDSGGNNDTNSNDVDHTLTVGFVEYGFIQASCPWCLGLPTEISSWIKSRFHEPTGSNHAAWVPREDEFCRQYYESPVNAINSDVGNAVVASAGAYSYIMNKSYDETGVIYESQTYTSDSNYVRNADLSLTLDGASLSSETFKSLEGFDYIEPYTMLYTDPTYAYAAPINKTSNTFSWGPSGIIDSFFTIHISVYSSDGASYYGTVICRSPDTGVMTIPGSYFTSYPSGSLTSIHLIRHRMKNLHSDLLQGAVQTHVWWEVIGTGFIQ